MKKLSFVSFISFILLLSLALSGCTSLKPTKQDKEIVGYVGEHPVYYDELRYFVMNYKTQVLDKKYGDVSADGTKKAEYLAELLEDVSSAITRNYAVIDLCEGFELDYNAQAILDKVESYVDETIEEVGSKSEYKKTLNELYLTDRFYRLYLQLQYAQNELRYIFADDLGVIPSTDEETEDYIYSDDFICTRHVLIYKDSSAPEAVKAKVEMIYDELEGGATFEDMIGSYSEDYQDTGNGYYFTYGEMDEEYETAAFALREGRYSEIVETDVAYYIIQRIEKDDEYIDENFLELKEQIQYALTYNKVCETQDKLTFVLNDYGKSLDLYSMK